MKLWTGSARFASDVLMVFFELFFSMNLLRFFDLSRLQQGTLILKNMFCLSGRVVNDSCGLRATRGQGSFKVPIVLCKGGLVFGVYCPVIQHSN